jgi:hypothetical protein
MTHDTQTHRHAWDQIPWIVNDSLPEAERLTVQSHLDSCADCRKEFEFQRQLASAIDAGATVDIDPRESWKRLRARIDGSNRSERPARHGQRRVRNMTGEWIPWLVAAMVVQAIGLGALGTVIWSKPVNTAAAGSAGSYRTLSAPESSIGNATVRVVFASDMSVGNMQALLAAAGLQVQSGPTSAGVWTLEPARDSNRSATQTALRELHDSPDVRFAEAIGSAP